MRRPDRREVSLEAEQAVLGAVLADFEAIEILGERFRPELFTGPHREIAAEVAALASTNAPIDAVLVSQRLVARGAPCPSSLPFDLARAMGTTANVRAYVATLESLWARREAARVMREALRDERDETGEEFVARVAEALSAIETRGARGARRLGEVIFERLERIEACQKDPSLVRAAIPTGFAGLDAVIGGFRPGHLVTIAARPGVGKTSFLNAIADHLGSRNVPVGVFVLEDYADALADRTIMRAAEVPSTLVRDGAAWSAEVWARVGQAMSARLGWPVFVDDTHSRTIHDVVGAMRRMRREHGCRVFFLDNLAEIVVDRADRADERLDRALGRIVKTYRDAAHALDAAPVVVVHLNRKIEERAGPPRLADLKNSGEIEDASHVVAMLSRPPESSELTLDVVKNRNGPTRSIPLRWEGRCMTVRESEGNAA